MQALRRRLNSLSPATLAFWGSLLLSLTAILGVVTIDRDGALYLDAARQISQQGAGQALQFFDWPWFSVLLALTHDILGLGYEQAAYLWSSLFMAGTCALLVDLVQRQNPEASRWACLVVLSLPAINQYRYDILREFGFWFFSSLALWQALRWQQRPRWPRSLTLHLAILLAALFRLEALILWPALLLWQWPALFSRCGHQRLRQLVIPPLAALLLAVLALELEGLLSAERVAHYLELISPRQALQAFHSLAGQFASTLHEDYSRDEAGQIIFFGLLAVVLIKFTYLLGPLALPFLHRSGWSALATFWQQYRPMAWTALLYLLVLMLFFIRQQFMISRYVSFLDLLLVPLASLALRQFARHFPRLVRVIIALAVVAMLDNVISLSAGKTQILDAGRWVAGHLPADAPVFYEDGRIAYYAGRGYPHPQLSREDAMAPGHAGAFRYYLIKADADEPWLQAWLQQHPLRILAQFANRRGDTVLAIGP